MPLVLEALQRAHTPPQAGTKIKSVGVHEPRYSDYNSRTTWHPACFV